MPLNIPSFSGDPTSANPIPNAYADIVDFRLSSRTQTLGFSIGYFRSVADYQANVAPVVVVPFGIGPTPTTRNDGAAFPSYTQVLGTAVTLPTDPAGTLAFEIVRRSIEAFLLTLPEFAGATIVA